MADFGIQMPHYSPFKLLKSGFKYRNRTQEPKFDPGSLLDTNMQTFLALLKDLQNGNF